MTHVELEKIKYRYRQVKDLKWEVVKVRSEDELEDCLPVHQNQLFIDGESKADLKLLLEREADFIANAPKDIEALLCHIVLLESKLRGLRFKWTSQPIS